MVNRTNPASVALNFEVYVFNTVNRLWWSSEMQCYQDLGDLKYSVRLENAKLYLYFKPYFKVQNR